jgi:hypothetical protein
VSTEAEPTAGAGAQPTLGDFVLRMKFTVFDCVGALPGGLLEALLRASLRGRRLAICLHRVAESRRPSDPVPPITARPDVLDSLIGRLVRASGAGPFPALTVTFDDGYADAAAYVRSRAPELPQVEWIYFVCPERIEKRIAFPWDEYEVRGKAGGPSPPDWNGTGGGAGRPGPGPADRPDGIADMREHQLATVEECRELSRLPNVSLGNHTNTHRPFIKLSAREVKDEIEASLADFERLFGRCEHLALPYGTPGLHFTGEHVAAVREVWDGAVWSTDSVPYAPAERDARTVLPRIAVDGTWPCSRVLAWCLRRCWAPRRAY